MHRLDPSFIYFRSHAMILEEGEDVEYDKI